ncbi:MAG: hypothetical protein NVSMB57_03690 [Actinomycetota bacterium]
MLIALRKRIARTEESGFTLIELMVVVLIIAILIAIAIPTFLGARKRAQDRAAQSNVRNAFTAEKTYYTDNQTYTDVAATMQAIEPSLTWVNAVATIPAASGANVYVDATTTAGTVYISAKSASGGCFYLKDSGTAATQFARDATCATAPSATAAGNWLSSW